jgi:hypothetical protein
VATSAPASERATPGGTGVGDKTTTVPIDSRLQVFVLELVDFYPMAQQEFDGQMTKEELIELSRATMRRTFDPKWWTLPAAEKRMDYAEAATHKRGEE